MTEEGNVGPFSRVRIADEVTTRRFDDELIVLDLARGSYFRLDTLGGRVLEKLASGSSPQEIADELGFEYSTVEPAVLLRDVLKLTNDLLDHGLLEPQR